MATEMIAIIEYDKEVYYASNYTEYVNVNDPFNSNNDTYSLTDEGWLYTGSKDYAFFSAIAGVRGDGTTQPLYPPRGLPPNPSLQLLNLIRGGTFDDRFATSWLTLREVHEALEHANINVNSLCFETILILDIMSDIEKRLGKDRVRLVFAFD